MDVSSTLPVLTESQQRELDAHGGMLQGPEYVMIRPAALLKWLGYESAEELRSLVSSGLDDLDQGNVADWDVQEFLDRMHRSSNS